MALACAAGDIFFEYRAAEISVFDDKAVLFLDDPSALAESLRDRSRLSGVAACARRLVQTQFSLRAMIDSYEQLYREVAEA